jgi:hypothetical protein
MSYDLSNCLLTGQLFHAIETGDNSQFSFCQICLPLIQVQAEAAVFEVLPLLIAVSRFPESL